MSVTPSPSTCKPFSLPNTALAAETLPCLYSNNVTEASYTCSGSDSVLPVIAGEDQAIENLVNVLTPYHRKAAETLHLNVKKLFAIAPSIGHIGFLTLTVPDNCSDNSEFRRRFRSFTTHYLSESPHFGHWICVKERQRRGAWHAHLLVIVSEDIRKGVNFDEFSNGKYKSASKFLRSLWNELQEVLPKYGFGRHELLPVKSNEDGMSFYVGKYISKHVGKRKEEDKGVRLISCSIGWPKSTVKWAWNTEGAYLWRRCLRRFAREQGIKHYEMLKWKYGPRWAYHLAPKIMGLW